jgi:hypothetical protein
MKGIQGIIDARVLGIAREYLRELRAVPKSTEHIPSIAASDSRAPQR